jgi:hypothetical protein
MQRSLLCSLARKWKWPDGRFHFARSLQSEGRYVPLIFRISDLLVPYKNAVHRCTIFECACRYILQTCRELWYSRPFFWLCVGDEKTSPKRNFLTRHTTYSSSKRLHTLMRNSPAGRRFHSRTFLKWVLSTPPPTNESWKCFTSWYAIVKYRASPWFWIKKPQFAARWNHEWFKLATTLFFDSIS